MNLIFLIFQPIATVIVFMIWAFVTGTALLECQTYAARGIVTMITTIILILALIDIWRNGF